MARTTGSSSGLLLRLLLVFPCFNVSLFQVTGQEASNPAYYADLFEYPDNANRSYRTDFCEKLNANRSNFEDDKVLSDFHISVGLQMNNLAKFDNDYDENGTELKILSAEYPGLVPRLLDELCARSGCTWRNTYHNLTNDSDDLPDGKTYADYLIWITDVYDLAAGTWFQTIERMSRGATFTDVWYDASIIMVGKQKIKPGYSFDLFSWVDPFKRSVWGFIVGTILFSAAVYYALERIDPNSDISETELTYMETLWMFGTAVTGQFEFAPKTNASRLFTFSTAFWALLVISAYTANLAAALVNRNNSVTIQIDTIQQAINSGKKMCVWETSGTDKAIVKEYPGFADSENYIRSPTKEDSYKKVLDGVCDIVITEQATWDTFQVDSKNNENCALSQIGDTWQRRDASFGVKGDSGQYDRQYCTSYLRDVFDYHLYAMKQDGTLEVLWAEQIKSTSTVDCAAGFGTAVRHLADNQNSELQMNNDIERKKNRVLKGAATIKNAGSEGGAVASNGNVDSDTERLDMFQLGGVFIFHYILTAASLILALLPWVYRKVNHRNHPEFHHEDKENGVIQDNKPPTRFKPKKARKLNLGGDGDKQSVSEEVDVDVFTDNREVMCENDDLPLPSNAATTEQVEELKIYMNRLDAKLDLLCSQNE